MITKYHAKYYANLLTQKSLVGELDSLSQSLLNATVDINPHQIEAALFAFQSPLSKDLIMADEVGLGKTISVKWSALLVRHRAWKKSWRPTAVCRSWNGKKEKNETSLPIVRMKSENSAAG